MNVLIVDDEPLARRRLVRFLKKLDWVDHIEEAPDSFEGREKVLRLEPDILLLDIQMPGGSGFDVLEKARHAPAVVFVTAFDHHALRAFEANAVDYLTKPVEQARFFVAMERARTVAASRVQAERIVELQEVVATLKQALGRQSPQAAFWVKYAGEHVRVLPDEIIRVQAERDYAYVHVAGAAYLVPENLLSVERRLDTDEFMRVHRSTVVRCRAVERIRSGAFSSLTLVLTDGSEVRVGRTYLAAVRARLAAVGAGR